MTEGIEMVKVVKVAGETPTVKSIYLDYNAKFLPGQFYMFWIPGLDEKPYVFSRKGKASGFSVHAKGEFSKIMFDLKPGDKIGVRGPYGNGFDLAKVKKAAIVSGGIGAAVTAVLAEELKKNGAKIELMVGCRSHNELLFEKRFKKTGDLYITTDDGSMGKKCFATDVLAERLKKKKFDMVYGCGPELMLWEMHKICRKKKQDCQASLERYMRCSIGICGECVIGDMLVCRDGPVFGSKQLARLDEFGRCARVKSGRKVTLREYYS